MPRRTAEQDTTTRRKGTQKALTRHATTYDSHDGFERTALIIEGAGEGQSGSVDLITPHGARLARINVFLYRDEKTLQVRRLIVDVIDVDDGFTEHRAVTFIKGARKVTKTGTLVSADFSDEL